MYQNIVIDIIKDVNEYMVYKMSATLFGSNHITQVVHLTFGDIPKTDLFAGHLLSPEALLPIYMPSNAELRRSLLNLSCIDKHCRMDVIRPAQGMNHVKVTRLLV